MFSRTFRPVISSANARLSHTTRATFRRGHSVISTHTCFPATLLRLNAGAAYKPFWFERQAHGSERGIDNQLEKSPDNQESAGVWTTCVALNRQTLMPNTIMMQEIIRTAAENYFEDEENGMSVDPPFMFTIPKGTTLPTSLVLLRETPTQFSLQPSRHTSPKDLDSILDRFYSEHADKKNFNEWLVDHEYEDAIAAENEKEWMSK